jgi:drug/metabolite transporter (DMT)-like permease
MPDGSGTRRAWYAFLLAITALMWAGQGTAVKVLDRHLGPIAITFLPFYVATLLLAPLLIRRLRADPRAVHPSAADWWRFVVAGAGGTVLAQLGMTWGVTKSLASNGAILNLLIPVITAVLASAMLKEKLTVLRMTALAVGLLGVLLMSVEDLRQSSFLTSRYLPGNILILGGCAGSAFYNVYCKGLLERFAEIEILIYSYITASLASLPLFAWVEPFRPASLLAFDWKSWTAFGFLALLHYGASMLLFFYVLKHIDVTVASICVYLIPVFGVILAVSLLGERMSGTAIAGAAVVLVATVLIMKFDAAGAA